MNKVLIFGGAALAALVPAIAGLAANPSLSASTPVPSQEVRLVEGSTRQANKKRSLVGR